MISGCSFDFCKKKIARMKIGLDEIALILFLAGMIDNNPEERRCFVWIIGYSTGQCDFGIHFAEKKICQV